MSDRPLPQHLTALARATEVRRIRFALKKSVQDGTRTLPTVLLHRLPAAERDAIANLRVIDVLRWQYRVGDLIAQQIIRYAAGALDGDPDVLAVRPLGCLTDRQRTALADAFEALRPTFERPRPEAVA